VNDRLRTAVVGPGRIARAHLVALRNNQDIAELAAIVGLPHEADRTRALAEEFAASSASDSLDEVLADPSIGAVVLTLPNHLHRPVAVKALEAGKHVLVEKPLANTLEDADEMIAAAAQAKRVLMVGQCRRFFPGARETKRRIPELGRPLDIIHFLGVNVPGALTDWWRSAENTGGLVLGLNGPHVIDTILWLIDARPVSVYAQTRTFKTGHWEGEDEATVVLTFADGSVATGHLSFNMKPHTNERWIIGRAGNMHLVHDRTLWMGEEKVVDGKFTPYIEGDESFDAQFREFVTAIAEGRQPLSSAQEARPVMEVLSAALRSAKLGVPVAL
jgi:predicted dehydrogenase